MQARSQDKFININGIRLRYRDQGQGPAVILVHGWTLDLDQWDWQVAALTDRFRLIRVDRRGFGLSSGYPSIAADSADLKSLCTFLAIKRVAILGMSQGARVAVEFANTNLEMISCVILDGPPYLGPPDENGNVPDVPFQHYCELARTRGLAVFREEWSGHALARLKTADPDAHALLQRMLARYPGTDLTATAPSSVVAPIAQGFESLQRPLLVINGEFDLDSRKRLAKYLAQHHDQVECAQIAGAGHLCCLDNPRAYTDVLRRFLERNTNRPLNS